MIMQQHSSEDLCNLLVQSLISRDEKLFEKVLQQDNDATIQEVLSKLQVQFVRKLIIELGNLISTDISVQRLKWIQHLLASKYTIISTMPDGRSILMPIVSTLEDRSSPQYYNKLVGLKGKLTLLKQLKEAQAKEIDQKEADVVVRIGPEEQKVTAAQIDSDTDTESEDEIPEDEDGEQGVSMDYEVEDEEGDKDEEEEEEIAEEDEEMDEEE